MAKVTDIVVLAWPGVTLRATYNTSPYSITGATADNTGALAARIIITVGTAVYVTTVAAGRSGVPVNMPTSITDVPGQGVTLQVVVG